MSWVEVERSDGEGDDNRVRLIVHENPEATYVAVASLDVREYKSAYVYSSLRRWELENLGYVMTKLNDELEHLFITTRDRQARQRFVYGAPTTRITNKVSVLHILLGTQFGQNYYIEETNEFLFGEDLIIRQVRMIIQWVRLFWDHRPHTIMFTIDIPEDNDNALARFVKDSAAYEDLNISYYSKNLTCVASTDPVRRACQMLFAMRNTQGEFSRAEEEIVREVHSFHVSGP